MKRMLARLFTRRKPCIVVEFRVDAKAIAAAIEAQIIAEARAARKDSLS